MLENNHYSEVQRNKTNTTYTYKYYVSAGLGNAQG